MERYGMLSQFFLIQFNAQSRRVRNSQRTVGLENFQRVHDDVLTPRTPKEERFQYQHVGDAADSLKSCSHCYRAVRIVGSHGNVICLGPRRDLLSFQECRRCG